MARSREARARRAQRRFKYADEVLGRVSDDTRVIRNDMAWNNKLALALPNHLTMAERESLMKPLAGMTAVELKVRIDRHHEEFIAWLHEGRDERDFKPTDVVIAKVLRLASRQEHVSDNGGKIVQPNAGLKGRVTRMDPAIVPSWERDAIAR